jgi:malate dehydrogenase (oxaloacetate-decarboxylating)
MPVALDVGTDRSALLEDPGYLGVRQRRLSGAPYLEFVDRFVGAVKARWPNAIIQWEDLSKETAFTVLDRYRHEVPSFNDDIQGTGAVALAGVLSACKLKREAIIDQRFVIYGAGAGGIGVASVIRQGLVAAGLSDRDALARIFVLDSKGLLVKSRSLEGYKQPFAQPDAVLASWRCRNPIPSLVETIENSGAGILLGLSGQPGTFTEDAVLALLANTARPVIFPLSNPTTSCEAQPCDLLRWSNGAAIVATGSPFEDVEWGGVTYPIGQGNNAFIFPGLGQGAIIARASCITDGMVLAAAEALADYTERHFLEHGLVYPPVDDLREASVHVTARVIEQAIASGVAEERALPRGDLTSFVRAHFWRAAYLPFIRAGQKPRRDSARLASIPSLPAAQPAE